MISDHQSAEDLLGVQRLRQNGLAELAVQFGAAQPRLRTMIALRLDPGLVGRIDPSDVIQDVYVEAARLLPQYLEEPQLSPFMWLRQVTGQRLEAELRSHSTAAKRIVDSGGRSDSIPAHSDSMVAELEQSMHSAHSVVSKAELTKKLLEIIESMSTDDREVLSLKQFEQLTFAEVAAELQITVDAAMKRFQRAILRLGKLSAHLNRPS